MRSLPRTLPRELLTLAIVAVTISAARSSLADHYVVPTGSMIPTVEPDDHVLVDKRAYGLRIPFGAAYALPGTPPARGDVVVLRSPEDGDVLLKRVAAVPGDVVTVTDGVLAIDGHPMPILSEGSGSVEEIGGVRHPITLEAGGGPDYGPLRVPEGHYLMLGDNRGNSRDGRWFGLVTTDAILGRVEGIILRDGAPTWVPLTR
jgi:signal peptidase I